MVLLDEEVLLEGPVFICVCLDLIESITAVQQINTLITLGIYFSKQLLFGLREIR